MNLDKIISAHAGKTIYRDGDKAIKVFDSGYSKSEVLNEALNQARIEETGIVMPKLQAVAKIDIPNKGECWAIVTDYIEGSVMSDILKNHPEKSSEYLDILIDLQISIHAKQAPPLLNKIKDKMKRKISETSFDTTTRYELQTRLESMPKRTKVCHGDFCPSNIIITPDGKPYVIDWAHATQGNASADAARTYLLFRLQDKAEMAEEYLNKFSNKSGIAKQKIQKWLPIVAASQSVKGKAEETEFLSKWVNVVEYQ